MTSRSRQAVRSNPLRRTRPLAPSLLFALGVAMLVNASSAALAQVVSREQDIVDLRLGQRVMVDDGSCPAGQLKEVIGSTMTASGITRTSRCVPRATKRK
jgi:hypothetical protein